VAVDGTGTTTTWYIGGIMEKLSRPGGVIEYRHFIPAGSGTAIYMRKPDGTNATTYLTTDHLGSGDLILDSAGNVLAKESFTAFGARRGSNWQGAPSSADYTTFANKTRRGFAGHEMLDAVGLVNMNGRVYDPLIGRFLSADPIIQTINLSQALNPYSYVMNMPLTLIDPSGYFSLGKFFRSALKFLGKALAVVALIVAPVIAYVGLAMTFSGSVLAGLSLFAYGTGVGLIAANQLHLPAWANELIALTTAVMTGGATLANIASTLAHHVEEYYARRELGRLLRRTGLTLAEVDAALEALSILGEELPNAHDSKGRLRDMLDGGVRIDGVGNRHWYGIPFDVADIALGYQGLPTGASWRYMLGGRIGRDIYDHSLGTLDGTNLAGLGLSGKVTSFSVPLGITAPLVRGSTVTLSAGDAVSGFFLGWIFNPTAVNSHGKFLAHGQCSPSTSG
jgi:RHS repeat-associated protein